MRGLTADERTALRLEADFPDRIVIDEEEDVYEALVEHGRLHYWEDGWGYHWRITEAGRQALSIDAALRALGAA